MRLRLERAASWLAYTDFPVIDAALAGGYHSREAFTRIFHTRFGCTPGMFRERARRIWKNKPETRPESLGKPYELVLPPMRVAAWPHIGPSLGAVTVWLKLGRWAKARGLLTSSARPVSVLHDDDDITPSARIRLDAAFAVTTPLRDTRLLMLHEPSDVPHSACSLFRLVAGQPIRCRLCIPIGRIASSGLPLFRTRP